MPWYMAWSFYPRILVLGKCRFQAVVAFLAWLVLYMQNVLHAQHKLRPATQDRPTLLTSTRVCHGIIRCIKHARTARNKSGKRKLGYGMTSIIIGMACISQKCPPDCIRVQCNRNESVDSHFVACVHHRWHGMHGCTKSNLARHPISMPAPS